MLMLLFRLGDSRYAIPVREVIEVTPHVELQALARTPDYVAGLCNYRGQQVPVIDLCRLVEDRCCCKLLTTRIMLVRFPTAGGGSATLGLLAEAVTETAYVDDAAFACTGVQSDEAPFLGDAAQLRQGLVRSVTVAELLPPQVQSLLFPAQVG